MAIHFVNGDFTDVESFVDYAAAENNYCDHMSYGQSILRDYLELIMPTQVVENHRPKWLFGLELDFFYPQLDIGIEFQGDQHFAPTFGAESLEAQKRRDQEKRKLCKRNGVRLVEVNVRNLKFAFLNDMMREAIRLTGNRAMPRWVEEQEWRPIDRRSDRYRLQLRRSFDSPTAAWTRDMRKRAKVRAEKRVGLHPIAQLTAATTL